MASGGKPEAARGERQDHARGVRPARVAVGLARGTAAPGVPEAGDFALVVCNFTPVVRRGYRIGVPQPGFYREVLNTDSAHYGGSNVGDAGVIETAAIATHGHAVSLALNLPPLGVVILLLDGTHS